MENLAVRFATTPAGQWTCEKVDVMLGCLNEAAMWSMQGSHSIHWAIFLPLMVFVQWTRFVFSAVLFVSFGKTVSKDDVQGIINPTRSVIHDIQQKGLKRREEQSNKEEEIDLNDFLLYRLTKRWPLRLLANFVRKVLYAFGIIPETALNNEEEAENKGESNEKSEEHRSEHEHHEHHY